MGFEKRDYSHSSIQGVSIPVPQAPVFSILDQVTLDTPQAYTWRYIIPPDGMVWDIVNFSCFANNIIFLMFQIELNDAVIWGEYHGYNIRWTPGVPSAFKVTNPDYLDITLVYQYATEYTIYWQMDFWREPAH